MRISRCRDIRRTANLFGEVFRSLKLRCKSGRPEDRHFGNCQTVGEPIDQRPFGSDHHQINVMVDAKDDDSGMVLDIKINQRRHLAYSGVARRGI